MNNLFNADWLSNTTSAVAAVAIVHALKWVYSRIRWPNGQEIGQLAKLYRVSLPKLLNALWYAAIVWFLWTQLQPLLVATGAPSRIESLLIAFWTWWSCAVLVFMLFDLKLWSWARLLKGL